MHWCSGGRKMHAQGKMSRSAIQFVVGIFVLNFHIVFGARILAVIPMASYSHQAAYRPLWRELVSRGHDLVLLTTNPMNDPSLANLKEISLSSSYQCFKKYDPQQEIQKREVNAIKMMHLLYDVVTSFAEETLSNPEVQNIIQNETEHFDLVMAESFFPSMYAFSKLFDCPLIALTSLDAYSILHRDMGNPINPVIYPDVGLPFVDNLSFKERAVSVAFYLFTLLYQDAYHNPRDQMLLDKYFRNHTTSMKELRRNVDMLFTISNPMLPDNRPIGPTTINIAGGAKPGPRKALPKDIETFLNGAKMGAIYFSLGSNVKSMYLNKALKATITQVFKELPYRVLWKFEADHLEDKPDNVKIEKWLPQLDVLRHPKVILFISQGGLQSLEESVFSRKPVLGLPFFADQDANVRKVARSGMGLYLDPKLLTKEDFKAAILEIIKNDQYKKSVEEIAELSEDQPMSGLEKAVWWTEYVIRRKGAKHLKYRGHDVPLYQQYFLDLIGAFIVFIVSIGFAVFYCTRLVFRALKYLLRSSYKTKTA